ncbi:MAG: hypothetical protein O3A20_02130 [Planctomycetota bacterium]|nr:hypothetical protein [Planctomycetota bacterium]
MFLIPILTCLAALSAQAPSASCCEPQESAFSTHRLYELQANSFESNRQVDPALAVDAEGSVLSAWGSRRQEVGTFGVFAQLMDARGRDLTTEIHVNTTLPGYQGRPSAAFLADGTAWIAWQSISPTLSECGIFARHFGWIADEEGGRHFGPLSEEMIVHAGIGDTPADAFLQPIAGGSEWLVAWASDTPERARHLLARRYSADGAPLGDAFRLGTTAVRESLVSMDSTPAGCVAVWSEQDFMGQPVAIAGALFGAEGATTRFTVATAADGSHVEPCVSAAADGSFVVAWMSSQDDEQFVTRARRFGADAQADGESFTIDAGGIGYHSGALVATAPDGRFLIAYNAVEPKMDFHDGERPEVPTTIRAQAFDADGAPLGEAFQLNGFDEGEQSLQVGVNARHMLWTAHDQLLAAWHGRTVAGDKRGIGLTMLLPDSLQLAAPAPLERVAAAQELGADVVHGEQAFPLYNPNFVAPAYVTPPPAAGGSGGFQGNTNTGWTPPDPDLAVGPSHVVSVVNGEIAYFLKSNGSKQFGQAIAGGGGFWGGQGASGFVFDPVALYDASIQRFIVAAADGAGSNDAICLAVSDDDDPNGGWHKYRFSVTSTCRFLDFPNLGVSASSVFLSGDCFNFGGNRIFMWDKAVLASGGSATMRQVQASGSTQSLGAVRNYDNATGYFCTTYSGSSTKLKIQAVRNANTSPTLDTFSLTVPQFSHPNNAVQLGTSNRADTIDFRIKNGVMRNGYLWVCHNNGQNGRSSVRWYQIALNNWPASGSPTLVQSGDVDPGAGTYTWFGDINVTSTNDAVVAFNRSSSSQYISIEYVFRKAADTLGTMRLPEQLQISTGPETGSRYGDYSGLEQDPTSDTCFWSNHEFISSGWRTWIGGIEIGDAQLDLASTLLIGGWPVTFTVQNLNPNETVTIFGTRQTGTFCPAGYGGLCLELGANAKTVGTAIANAAGAASLSRTVPANLAGRTVYIQAAAIRGVLGATSVKSNRLIEIVG